MHVWVKELNLYSFQSLTKVAYILEDFAKGDNLCYRAKLDTHIRRLKEDPDDLNSREAIKEFEQSGDTIFYFGEERRIDHLEWLNYQVNLFKTAGQFKGDCSTMTTIQLNMYKAAGIPALGNQIYSLNPFYYHHNSPMYYNHFIGAWQSIQFPSEDSQGYYNYIRRPIWHHRLIEEFGKEVNSEGQYKIYDNWWIGEYCSFEEVFALRKGGFPQKPFESFFRTIKSFESKQIYNSNTTLYKDSDYDKIPDKYEKSLGLSNIKFDSDGNGLSDLWEVENGSQYFQTVSMAMFLLIQHFS